MIAISLYTSNFGITIQKT